MHVATPNATRTLVRVTKMAGFAAGLLVLLMGAIVPIWAAPPAYWAKPPAYPETLRTASAVRNLSPTSAQRGLAVEVTGVVTYVDAAWNLLFVQDKTAGIFVFVETDRIPGTLQVGSRVTVRGITAPGDFCPSIKQAQVVVIGDGSLPKPIIPNEDALFAGYYDSQWGTLSGIVRSARQVRRHLYISVMRNGRHFTVTTQTFPNSWLTDLVDSEVQVTGVITTRFNTRRQVIGINVELPEQSLFQIRKAAFADPYALPQTAVGRLGQFSLENQNHREHIRGTVEAVDPVGVLFVSDGKDSVEVLPGGCTAKPGDLVDVAGFPTILAFRRSLEDAVCRVVGSGTVRAAQAIAVRDVLQNGTENQESNTKNDMSIVQVDANLLRVSVDANVYSLVLQEDGTLFTAALRGPQANELPHLEPGTRVRLSGLCAIRYDSFQKAESFQLLLRSPADVRVLSKPSWWSARHTTWVLGFVILLGGLGGLWVIALRRRVERQTAIIRSKLEREVKLENRYRQLFETNVASVCCFTPDGTLLDCNRAFAQLVGYCGPADLIGTRLADGIVSAASWSDFVEKLEHSDTQNYLELNLVRLDGQRLVTLASGVRTEGEDHRPELQVTLMDVTQQRRFEQELIAAKESAETGSRRKSGFLANMSHEIRTPLNGVLGMTSLALSSDLSPEVREYLGLAKDSATHLLLLLNDVLDYSKMEAGKLELEQIPFAPRDVFRQAIRTVAVRGYEKNLELFCAIEESVPLAVVGDPHRLQQVILNLLGNAIKFTAQGQVILRAGAQRQGAHVEMRVEVEDSGIGISPQSQARIFESFEQANGSTTREHGGTGLGLSICRELVGLMGGQISLTSKPGLGSTFAFTCYLPVSEQSIGAIRQRAPGALAGREVLLLLENEFGADIVAQMLKRWDVRCSRVRSVPDIVGRTAQARENGIPCPLVLLDGSSRGLNPVALAEELNRYTAPRSNIIPLFDSMTLQRGAEQFGAAGFSNHLLKPLDEEEIRQALLKAVEAGRHSARPNKASPPKAATPSAESGLKILLVEDNLVNQKVACALLKRLGHKSEVANNGLEAVDAMMQNLYDAVLMDVQMPVMDGFEATARIRALPDAKRSAIPIIALTAHAMEGYRERCLAAGMSEYVTKPINVGRLAEALNACVAAAASAVPQPATAA